MKHRLSQPGMAIALGLLLAVCTMLLAAPAATQAEAAPRPSLDTVVLTRTIGTGTTTFSYGPFYNYYENNKTQMIYLGSEIAYSGVIRQVAFDITQVGTSYRTLKNFTIRLMEITPAAFSTAYLDTSAATVVYGGSGYSATLPGVTRWVWFDITDFNFHADKNLLVEVVWGDNGGYANTYYQVNGTSTAPAYRTVYGYADNETPPAYDGRSDTRPNLRFEIDATPTPFYAASKSVSPWYTDGVVTYTVVFTNTGLLTGSASLSDPLPPGTQYVPESVTGGAVYSDGLNAIVWGPGGLASNDSVTTTFQVTLTATSGSVINTATISDAASLAPVSASAVSTRAVANFSSSSKTASGSIHPAGILTYTVVVYNSADTVRESTTLIDPIPVGAAYLPGSASVQGGGMLVADTSGITWTGAVLSGQKVTVTFGVSLTALTGNITNTVYISNPTSIAPVSKAASIAVQPYAGGPNDFGYIYRDSYAPGGPVFTWIEPLTTSKLITLASGTLDQGYYLVNLPFPFAFYTNIYTQAYPSTNGLLAFGTGTTSSANAAIPSSAAPNNYAACYWDDLVINNPSIEGVYFETMGVAPNRIAILTFSLEEYVYSFADHPMRFQMQLFEGTNQIVCQYKDSKSIWPFYDGQSATIGLENATGTGGLQYAYNRAPGSIEDGLAIAFTPPQDPGYEVAKTVQPTGLVYPGSVLTYSLTITNFVAMSGTVTMSDPLPSGVTFVGPVPTDPVQPVFDGYAVTWTGPVTAGQSITVRFLTRVLPSLSGVITNTALISDSLIAATLSAQASNTVARPSYGTSYKTVSPIGTVNTGQLLTYTVAVVNSGQLSSTATLVDAVPAGSTYVLGSATILAGGGSIVEAGGTITWTGTVTNGATIQVRLNAIVNGNYGVITNTATITDPTIAAPVSVSAANTIASPLLSASTKTVNSTAVQVGGPLTYTVLVKNTGALTATAANLTDALPPQVTLDPARLRASSGTVTGTASSVNWNGMVAAGATVFVTIPVVVSNDCCRQSFVNTAVISQPILPAPVVVNAAPVVVYGPDALLNESFEGAFPPIGWATTVVTTTDAPAWTHVITGDNPVIPTGPYAGAYLAKFNSFDVHAGGSARLSSGSISLAGASNPVLHFAMYHDPGYSGNADRIQVQISTDNGLSYQNVGLPILRYAPIAGWVVHSIDLSAYSGQAIRLGFLAISGFGNNLFIDAIGISACGFVPTGVHFTFDPPLPQLGQPITFTGSIVTGTAPVTYTWDFGDGTVVTDGSIVTHTYASGIYTIILTATNQYGSAAYSAPVTVFDLPILGLTASNSSPTRLGQVTFLTATISSGSNVTYTWDFGNLTSGSGDTTSHVYAASGVYTAMVTALNNASTITASTVITIIPRDPVTVTLTSSPNPATVGQTVVFTATLNPIGAAGSMQFYDNGTALGGAVAVVNGAAQFGTARLTVGAHVITATYSGDADHVPASALPLNQVILSICDPVTGVDFSWLPLQPALGQLVNFTALQASGSLPITYTWNFGHGVDVITTTANIVHSFPSTSTTRPYTVTLAATNACSTQAAAPKLITVQPVQVYLPLILK